MKILVITTLPDPHVDMVSQHLQGKEIVVFDPYRFSDEELSLSLTSRGFEALTREGDLGDVHSVWYRKPILLPIDKMPVDEKFKKMAHSSYTQVVTWLYSILPDRLWVSDYWKIKQAGSKVFQLNLATSLGFPIPATIITSSEKAAKKFLSEQGDCVVKPPNLDFVEIDGNLMASYTNRVSSEQNIDFRGLSISPVIFQQEIKGKDVRVTVIGEDVFPCIVEKDTSLAENVDWRTGLYDDSATLVPDTAFPQEMIALCLNMVKKMGLKFGAFDFIKERETGRYYFLEVNPNGQWGFVELYTGMPLSKCMADLLVS